MGTWKTFFPFTFLHYLIFYFIKRFYLLSLSYVVAWILSVWNAYTLYIEISELKSEIAQGEIEKEGRKKAIERLTGKAK